MKEFTSFLLKLEPNSEHRAAISKLNKLLNKAGIEIRTNSHFVVGEWCHTLFISYDAEKAHEYLSRGAGRRKKQTEQLPTVGEVRQMLKEAPAADVASRLGISRATLFRRLKDKSDEESFDC